MPQPRKSAQLLIASGAYEKNPKRRRRDVLATGQIGPCPVANTEVVAAWDELAAGATAGVLTASDRQSLELAAVLLAHFRQDPLGIPGAKMGHLIALLGKLGMNPSARLQMNTAPPKDKDDPAEKFFR